MKKEFLAAFAVLTSLAVSSAGLNDPLSSDNDFTRNMAACTDELLATTNIPEDEVFGKRYVVTKRAACEFDSMGCEWHPRSDMLPHVIVSGSVADILKSANVVHTEVTVSFKSAGQRVEINESSKGSLRAIVMYPGFNGVSPLSNARVRFEDSLLNPNDIAFAEDAIKRARKQCGLLVDRLNLSPQKATSQYIPG